MSRPWMSVVVPVYNEESAIAGTVSAVLRWLEGTGRRHEVVVVDNASEDGTAEVLGPFLDDRRVRLLRNDRNRGKGFSVRRGMLEARGELRLLCDADCAPSLASLGRMVELMGGADVVAGSRLAEGARVDRAQPIGRRLVGSPFIALTRIVMWEPTRDVYCGFKLWRDEAAEAVFARQTLDGWAFDAESLALARRLGFRVREAGIIWNDREGSRLSIRRVLIPVVRELVRARKNVRSLPPETRPPRSAISPPEPFVPDAVEPRS